MRAMLAEHAPDDFRAAVLYYGIMSTPPKHAAVTARISHHSGGGSRPLVKHFSKSHRIPPLRVK
jgi:hypothetical protein